MQSSTNGDDGLLLNTIEHGFVPADDVGLSRCVSVNETDDESEASSEVILIDKYVQYTIKTRTQMFACVSFC
jgi:hypothetical protein